MWINARKYFALIVLTVVATSCAPSSWDRVELWSSSYERDHPLVGRIWDVAGRRFVSEGGFFEEVSKATVVLLGEKHDNVDHHRIQSRVVKQMYSRGRRPAIAFEMLTDNQRDALAAHLAARPHDAGGIADAVGWARTGWGNWRHYQPIAQQALAHGQRILAAGLSRQTLRGHMAPEGAAPIEPADKNPLPPQSLNRLQSVIRVSHCDQISARMIDSMTRMQMAKDAHMAAVLLEAMSEADGAVLIAGGGHARTDFGVPWHLTGKSRGMRVVSLALVEVTARRDKPEDYGVVFESPAPPFDYLWFTPRHDTRDPCDAFADQLRRIRKKTPAADTK